MQCACFLYDFILPHTNISLESFFRLTGSPKNGFESFKKNNKESFVIRTTTIVFLCFSQRKFENRHFIIILTWLLFVVIFLSLLLRIVALWEKDFFFHLKENHLMTIANFFLLCAYLLRCFFFCLLHSLKIVPFLLIFVMQSYST